MPPVNYPAVKPFRPLTVQEERVRRLVARGWSNKRIASSLGLSVFTVKHHIRAIANILPEDGLPARRRVEIWALCVEIRDMLAVTTGSP